MDDLPEEPTFGMLLRSFREQQRLTRKELAYKVRNRLARKKKVNPSSIYPWETDQNRPEDRETILALAYALQLPSNDVDRLLRAAERPLLTENEKKFFKQIKRTIAQQERLIEIPSISSPVWNVPFPRNPYFTGRETHLKQLQDAFFKKQQPDATLCCIAVSGLGGIGKTQIALEYAYQHYNDYKAVFWVRADSKETLLAGFMSIASALDLPESEVQEQARIVTAVTRWFQVHAAWLLILDNVDDLVTLQEFMPTLGKGSILITSRMQSFGEIVHHPMEVDVMEIEEGMLFLLRRAGLLSLEDTLDTASETNRAVARNLVEEMDGLPLALDQAGAYIEETGCSLSRYLSLFKRHRAMLLKRRGMSSEYHQSVATTWSLSFQRVDKNNPVAAEMLRLCAFLHPDAIPEDIFIQGGNDLGQALVSIVNNPLILDDAIDTLRRYSFIKRNPEERTLTIHRLVQIVLKDTMKEEQQRQWAERTVRVVNHAFSAIDFKASEMWPLCQLYLPHAYSCLELIEQYDLVFPETVYLLYHVAQYLFLRGSFREMEPFCFRALAIQEQLVGPNHLDLAENLDCLAEAYHQIGRYNEVEPLRQRVLLLRERYLGSEHLDTAKSLYHLGRIYFKLGRDDEAEEFHQRALALRQKVLEPKHPDIADSLKALAILYQGQQRYAEAEAIYRQILSLHQDIIETSKNRSVTVALLNLGVIYFMQKRYNEAEPIFLHVLAIYENALGPEHPDVADPLFRLGQVYRFQQRYAEAEPLYLRSLAIEEKTLGPIHYSVLFTLATLGHLHYERGDNAKSREYLHRVLETYKTMNVPELKISRSIQQDCIALLQKLDQG